MADAGLAALSAVELRSRYAEGSLSPVEVHDAVQGVIAAREPVVNAFWQHDPETSRVAAKASEQRWQDGRPLGPVDGIPLTLKENIARAGVPMPAGTAGVEPTVPDQDAPITARVLDSGGVVLGSTVMPDWGMLSSGVSSLHGVTRSPWDPSLTTGGSSAGAGAAAVAGYGPLHVGTDIGGSIRLPGTWLGLATLKPSGGRVPLDAPYLGRAAGPMARTVADLALFMDVLSRPDDRDWTSLPPHTGGWELGELDPRGLRVGLHLDAGCGGAVEPEILEAVRGVADLFADAGAEVEELGPFLDEDLLDAVDLFWRVRSLHDFERLSAQQRHRVLPYIATWVAGGASASGTRVLECYQEIMRMQAVTVAATLPFDVVLSPVAPVPAFPAEQPMPYPDNGRGMRHIGFTVPYNMSGQPAATVNAGFTPDGRTIGVQLAGRRFDDPGVLRAAAWVEANRPPSAVPPWPDGAAAGS